MLINEAVHHSSTFAHLKSPTSYRYTNFLRAHYLRPDYSVKLMITRQHTTSFWCCIENGSSDWGGKTVFFFILIRHYASRVEISIGALTLPHLQKRTPLRPYWTSALYLRSYISRVMWPISFRYLTE